MSRAYRVSVKGSVSRVVHVEDGICTTLELLSILPAERQSAILTEELVRRGFTAEGEILVRKEEDGVRVEVDVKTGNVSVKAEATENIDIEKEQTASIEEEVLEAGTRRAQEKLDAQVIKEADEAEKKARDAVTKKLEQSLGDLKRELDSVTTRVTAESLKEKARGMGEIEELSENAETGELTIKVKL